MKPLKIVHIISSLERGGAQTVLASLIQGLSHPDFEHHVFYMHDGPHRQIFNEQGIHTYSITGLLFAADPFALWKMIRQLRRIRPDCIHSLLWAANFYARIAARIVSLPLVCALHNMRDHNGLIRNFLDAIPWGAAHLVAVSPAIKEGYASRWIPARCAVIENGVDAHAVSYDTEQRKTLRLKFGLSEHHFVVGSVGRFEPVKRYEYLIRAFDRCVQENPEMLLMLVGSGSQEQALRLLVRALSLENNVIFIVNVSASSYYQLFDCFVQSSRTEGISLALLEAMSIGLPCVVTETSNHPVITHNYDGFIVAANDISMLAETITRCFDEKETTQNFGGNAKNTVMKRFENGSMIARYKRLFENLYKK